MKRRSFSLLGRSGLLLLIFLIMFLMMFLMTGAADFAYAGPVGMVTQLKGDVVYQSPGEESLPAKNFMKVREGDIFNLPAESLIQLVFFETGRKESWQGPVAFEAGSNQGKGKSENAPAVSTLPENVANEVRRVSLLVDISRLQKTGSSAVRGVDGSEEKSPRPSLPLRDTDKKEIEMALNIYKQMQKSSTPDDITPEIYLFSVMADYDQFEEMAGLVDLMKKKQPENEQIDLIAGWMEDQM